MWDHTDLGRVGRAVAKIGLRVACSGALLCSAALAGAASLHAQDGGEPALVPPLRGELPPVPEPTFHPEPEDVAVTTVASGFDTVWSLDFAPDGRLFVTERAGRVRVIGADGVLASEPWVEFPDVVRREDGLLGLVLHPNFENEPWVYLFYTIQKGDRLVNRISRFREVDGHAGEEEVLLDDLDSFDIHNGGRLRFGPDGMLYVTMGELGQPMLSQDLSRLQGSVLRLTPEGEVPWDNPLPGNPIWAYGLRNPHGLAFRPGDGKLFLADNGPSGEWGQPRIGSRDEISIIEKGENYGWPLAVGAPNHPAFVDPIIAWIPSQPPGDLTFYDADLFPELKGDLLYATLRGETLMRIRFEEEDEPDRITAVEWWFHDGQDDRFGRLRGMTVGPDGAIYVGTSNFGRSSAREGDDRILRIAPAG